MASDPPVLVWLRDDLRLADNPALHAAARRGRPVLILYVLDETPGLRQPGGASRWWLHHSLAELSGALERRGQRLVFRRGEAADIVADVAKEAGATLALWNRRYGHAVAVDAAVAEALARDGVGVETFKANLLFEPDEVTSRDGRGFRVYSAFWRGALGKPEPRDPLPAPGRLTPFGGTVRSATLDSFGLLPTKPDWAAGLRATWTPGEAGAAERLDTFVNGALEDYAEGRDLPAESGTSRLSPHLRFGEISPYQIVAAVRQAEASASSAKFLSEIGWREFAWHILDAFPDLASKNLRPEFDRFPWQPPTTSAIAAWQQGRTGYPIVDAGMRALWTTGWMHNRVRMIVASFLTKHLLIDWREGEAWFWDTLVDADPANNPFGWQWVAGSGADAQPYFRIFNPTLQGEKFDPAGAYVRRWAPELAGLPDRFIHEPSSASPLELAATGVTLGRDYPRPIVDHGFARARALEAFAAIRK